MAAKTKARKKVAKTTVKKAADPWSDVGHGGHLHIGHFLTFQLIRLANAAKSNVTRRYLADFAGNYVTYYAGLASAMIALVFLYFSAWIFIYGGELNAAIERARQDAP